MKKYVMFTMLIAMMVCLLAVPGHIEAAPDVSVKVDGQYVSFPDQKPYIDSVNRTMVPVRAPMEKMGCTVDWNDQTRQATITKGDKTAVFTIGKNTYTVNGQNEAMDTKAVITNDRTAFPIRFCAEVFGAEVGWDQATYTVIITTGKKEVVLDPEKPYVMEIPKSADISHVDKITVEDYNIIVTNSGVGNPNEWFVIIDQGAYQPKPLKVICTSNPELNEHNTMFLSGKRQLVDCTKWSRQGYTVFKNNYSKNPKSGDTLIFDVYGKVKDEDVKLVVIKKILP